MSLRPPLPKAKTADKKKAQLGAPKAGLAHKKKLEGVPKPAQN
jgi:hypothetical protein